MFHFGDQGVSALNGNAMFAGSDGLGKNIERIKSAMYMPGFGVG